MTENPYPNLGFNPVPCSAAEVAALGTMVKAATDAVIETNTFLARIRSSIADVHLGRKHDATRPRFDTALARDLGYAQTSLENSALLVQNWHTTLTSSQQIARTLDAEAASRRASHARAIDALQRAKSNPDFDLATEQFTTSTQWADAQARLDRAAAELTSAVAAVNTCQRDIDAIIERAANLQSDTTTNSSVVGDNSITPHVTPLPSEFPPVVYLPVLTEVQRVEEAQIMLRQTQDGRVACLAYSALDRLHHCCGSDQPWMWTPTVALDALQLAQPFELLFLDLEIPEENRLANLT
ncbi:SAV_915 family protein [Nocardia fluminea]|uniref:SAV_915 family protein n=1 Tax=Nocardia fluminea TaxID=134984 RepID=UPI00366BD465